MSIKRYNSTKDNTLVNALRENLSSRGTLANLGASDILELYSIYGQANTSSLESTRIIMQFPVDTISSDRSAGTLPVSGSVKFKLKMSNTPHGQTTPENFTVSVHPIVRDWTEGDGLDMESFLNKEASNWISASAGVPWHTTGSDFVSSSYVATVNVPLEYTQALESGTENISIDITPWTEEWLKSHNSNSQAASASVELLAVPSVNDTLTIYSHEGKKVVYTFINTSTYTVGNDVFLEMSASAADIVKDIHRRLSTDFDSKITTARADAFLALTQSVGGFHGNTIISTTMDGAEATITQFAGGHGLPNYGLVLKLRNDFEDGSKQRSYYTKKFYSRSSHEFFLKPKIEAQWDSAIKDDRNYIIKSSSLAPASENLNNIYYYNRFRGSLVDIPNTGSRMVAQLYPTLGGSPATIVQSGGTESTFITASKADTGIYKATFAYSGSNTTLYDVWKKDVFTAAIPEAQAVATINVDGFPVDAETFTVQDTAGNTETFIFVGGVNTNDGSKDGSDNTIIGLAALADTDALIDRIVEVFAAQTDIAVTAARTDSKLRLTQDTAGADGNTTIDLSGVTNFSHNGDNTGFHDGVTAVAAYHTYTDFVTGSGFTVYTDDVDVSYSIPSYAIKITNLKDSYLQTEKTTLRVYTRNKNWQPNIYTVAKNAAPVSTIRDLYYKIVKVSDNYEVISYSTGSTPSWSSISYDVSGSFFDLDMSLLEKNNAYEISFVFKDGANYIEQQEKFRFRVDP